MDVIPLNKLLYHAFDGGENSGISQSADCDGFACLVIPSNQMTADGKYGRLEVLDVPGDGRQHPLQPRPFEPQQGVCLDDMGQEDHDDRWDWDNVEARDGQGLDKKVQVAVLNRRVGIGDDKWSAGLGQLEGIGRRQDGFKVKMSDGRVDSVCKGLENVRRPTGQRQRVDEGFSFTQARTYEGRMRVLRAPPTVLSVGFP